MGVREGETTILEALTDPGTSNMGAATGFLFSPTDFSPGSADNKPFQISSLSFREDAALKAMNIPTGK